MGWLPNHRGAEGALVFPYTDEAGGVLGLHFTFVTPTGEKSPNDPARQTRRGPPDWRTKGRALLRLDFGTGPEMVVAEGFENALAISLAGSARVVAVGAVGAYGRCPLPRTVETITLAHDGDDPDTKSEAAQAYHRGVVRYLGQGLMLKMTAPPTGCDPNDVLKRGGPDALKKLLTEARCDLGKFDNAAFLNEVCRLDDLSYDRARVTALELLGLRQARHPGQRAEGHAQTLGRDAGKHRNPAGPRRRPALARTGDGHRAGARRRPQGNCALCCRSAAPDSGGDALERLCALVASRGSRHRRRTASRHSKRAAETQASQRCSNAFKNAAPNPILSGSISASSTFPHD